MTRLNLAPEKTGIHILCVTVLGEPKGQPRTKTATHRRSKGGKLARLKFPVIYTPDTADNWKRSIAYEVLRVWDKKQFTGPLSLTCEFVFGRPKTHYGTGKNAGVLKASAPSQHTGTPDLDNILKAAKDAITDVGLWRNDSLVCQYGWMEKRYVNPGEVPHAVIRIETIERSDAEQTVQRKAG
ncbi:MAG: RusA family crossover junction endodeoxyribonuclease [Chlamydiota bacterium]